MREHDHAHSVFLDFGTYLRKKKKQPPPPKKKKKKYDTFLLLGISVPVCITKVVEDGKPNLPTYMQPPFPAFAEIWLFLSETAFIKRKL